MKSIVFLFAGFGGCAQTHAFEPLFDSRSAVDRALDWAVAAGEGCGIFIAVTGETEERVRGAAARLPAGAATLVSRDSWNTRALLEEMAAACASAGAESAVYASASQPFLDAALAREVLDEHRKYLAEYTFADGYPQGFAPEVLDAGALRILASLAAGSQRAAGDAPVASGSIFAVMQKDVNSFEIETVIAPRDWRMLRLELSCSGKAGAMACAALWSAARERGVPLAAAEWSAIAAESVDVLRTVPAFYNVQASARCASRAAYSPYVEAYRAKFGASPLVCAGAAEGGMGLERFRALAAQAAALSEEAVVGLGAWGEPLALPDVADYVAAVLEHPGLSVLVETDGLLLEPQVAERVAQAARDAAPRLGSRPPVLWIVSVDAATDATYAALHADCAATPSGLAPFAQAQAAVGILAPLFPGAVYPQMLRMNANEGELEAFWRYWHDAASPSGGNVIIQKYDGFCGLLPDERPADLAPLERNPCWHLRRDMTVLADGGVPLCREHLLDGGMGNVFSDGLAEVWGRLRGAAREQVGGTYNGRCGNCDEYYTYNF